VGQTTTDPLGRYHFDLFSGVGPGTYTVVEVLPGGLFQTTADPAPIQITRGETVSRVDFGNSRMRGPDPPPVIDPVVTPGLRLQTPAEFADFVRVLVELLESRE